MSIDFNTIEKNPNDSNGYYYKCSYDINYNGLTIKDIGLGKYFCLEKLNNTFIITTPFGTGL